MIEEEYIRVIGIDPGTSCLGFAVIKYCLSSHAMYLEAAVTIEPTLLNKRKGLPPELTTNRPRRLNTIHDTLVEEFCRYEPALVASESAFLGRFPGPFAALTECIAIERRALFEYDSSKILVMITPPTVKVAAGVPHNSNDKEDMRRALKTIKDVDFGEVDTTLLDEHAIDAIHIARCAVLQARGIAQPYVREKKSKGRKKKTEGDEVKKKRKKRKKRGRR